MLKMDSIVVSVVLLAARVTELWSYSRTGSLASKFRTNSDIAMLLL